MRLKNLRLWGFRFLAIYLVLVEPLGRAHFDNYFKELTRDSNTQHAEEKLEAALSSVLRRLQVPFVDEHGSVQTRGFFENLEKKVKAKDPGAQVYISGGVVRSLLGYLYKKVYTAREKNPQVAVEAVLDKIIQSDKEILTLAALGVGSDLDILIDPSQEGHAQKDVILREVKKFINSAEKKANLREVKSKFKNAIVPRGDVKDYQDQTLKTTEQGGSALDWLAFPLPGGKMRTPESHSEIFKQFIQGEYSYLAPKKPTAVEDPDKQTIRGLRPLLEIPFLHVSKNGVGQLKMELEKLIQKVKKGNSLSEGAMEQFEKMIRNARFEGAHNRFSVLDPHHPQGDQEIEALVYQLSEASEKGEKKLPLVPEFLVNNNPKKRGSTDLCGLREKGLLMDPVQFVKDHTHEGKLYHGTPQLDNILSIIRNGFVVSTDSQGLAAHGRGTYSTRDREFALSYGTPIEFTLKKEVNPRILDWQKVEKKPEIVALVKEAAEKKVDLHRYLSENCDVDIVVKTYVLIQNSGVF